jgi:hypothetical protein
MTTATAQTLWPTPEALLARAKAHSDQKQFAEAERSLLDALDAGAPKASTYHSLAVNSLAASNRDKSLEWLEFAYANGFWSDPMIKPDPLYQTFKDDAAYRKLAGLLPLGDVSKEQGRAFDLDHLEREIRRIHPNPFRVTNEAQMKSEFEKVRMNAGKLSDSQFASELVRLVSLVGDGHTFLLPSGYAPLGIPPVFRSLPISFYQYSDGVFIQRATAEHKELLGAKLLKVGEKSAEQALQVLRSYVSVDNEAGYWWRVPQQLSAAELLEASGLAVTADAVQMTFQLRNGQTRSVELHPLQKGAEPETFRATKEGIEMPLYRSNVGQAYWLKRLENSLIYFQYNAVDDLKEDPFSEFCERLLKEALDPSVRGLIIDLRHNGGGDNELLQTLIHSLVRLKAAKPSQPLYVITSRHTFSAAMNCATRIQRAVGAVFVGEPTGSRPNHYGEFNMVRLPYTGLAGSVSSLLWQDAFPNDSRPWIVPDLPAQMSSEDYWNGRDPAMEAILNHIGQGQL